MNISETIVPAVTVIPLPSGEPGYPSQKALHRTEWGWELRHAGAHVCHLSRLETVFVNAAIAATSAACQLQPAQAEPN